MLARALAAPIERVEPASLPIESWAFADEMGWAKTYDANTSPSRGFSAVGSSHSTQGFDGGLRGSGFVIGPTEL